jgi:ornithine carrier protein
MALYRGLPSPLICGMGENLILFSVYGNFTRMIHSDENIPLYKQCLGGAVSGTFVSFFMTPVELIKCRMQTSNESAPRFKSTLQCFLHTIRSDGLRGLFRGQVITAFGLFPIIVSHCELLSQCHTQVSTMCREIPGNAVWFGGYEGAVCFLVPRGGTKRDVHPAGHAAAGAVGGMCYWLVPFPFDVAKSRIQTGTHGLPPGVTPTVAAVLRSIYAEEGLAGLYRGCALTMLRAAPTSATLFAAYEITYRLLDSAPLFSGPAVPVPVPADAVQRPYRLERSLSCRGHVGAAPGGLKHRPSIAPP